MDRKWIHYVFSTGGFVARHLIASVISVLVPVIVSFVAYFGLLLIALLTNSGLGGPLALPFMVVSFLILSVVYTTILLFPIVTLAEMVSQLFGKRRYLAQIPISTAMLALVFASGLIFKPTLESDAWYWLKAVLITFGLMALPLGLYWWTAKTVEFGIYVPTVLFKKIRHSRNTKVLMPQDA